ncbi:hypothetical protein FOZ62_001555, partial [Perkinsus olseni]
FDPILKGLPDAEVAIPEPGGKLTYYLLRNGFLTDFKRCKSSLLEELSAHQVVHLVERPQHPVQDGVLKLDHSRAASKKLTISHAAGYICCLIDGHNIIHNIVVTGTTSYRELAGCFQELKPRINLGDAPLTVFTDNACYGNPSQTLRATIEANCGIPNDRIRTKLECLHSLMRLTRSCNLQPSRYCAFARSLGQAMFVSSKGDLELMRSKAAKKTSEERGARGIKVSKSVLRRSVRRIVPDGVTLNKRLERVVKCYVALDAESIECHGDKFSKDGNDADVDAGSHAITLLTPSFWLNYKAPQRHILHSCNAQTGAAVTADGLEALQHLQDSLAEDAFNGPPPVAAMVPREGTVPDSGPPPITMADLVHAELIRQGAIPEDSLSPSGNSPMRRTVHHPPPQEAEAAVGQNSLPPEAAVAAAMAAVGADAALAEDGEEADHQRRVNMICPCCNCP